MMRLGELPIDGYGQALARHVAGGCVDYRSLAVDSGFLEFVLAIGAADPGTAGRAERLAFLINSYNALAVRSVLDGLSPETLVGRLRFFLLHRHRFAGHRLSLFGLEQRHLIPAGEPRIHFAIVCASASCPRLRPAAYRAATLDDQLAADAREFVNDRSRNHFDEATGVARISRLFRWYRRDFEHAAGSVPAYLANYVEEPWIADRLADGGFSIEYMPYDWRLNGVAPSPR